MHSMMKKAKQFIIGAFVSLAIAAASLVIPMTAQAAQPVTPTITPGAGYYSSAVLASVNTDPVEAFCTVYTTDGSTPSAVVSDPNCLPSGSSQSYSAPFSVIGSNGTSVQVRAISYDSAGIASLVSSETYSFDTTAPIITGVTSGAFYGTDITPSFTDVSPLSITLNGVAYIQGTPIVLEGHYSLVATDSVGFSTISTFTIDKTAPTISIVGANPLTHEIMTSFNDPGISTFDANGVVNTWTTGGLNISTVGSYIITYHAKDAAGNESTATRVVNVIDTTFPVVGGVADNSYNNNSLVVTYSDTNSPAATLNNLPFASGTVVSAEGVYTLVVTDLAGNTTTVHFVIDKTNPTVAGVTNASYYNSDVVISFSDLNLAGATLNGAPFGNGSVVSAEGIYTLVVTDLAGNTTTITFVIDKTSPLVNGVVDGAYYNHEVAISYSDLYLAGATLNNLPFASGTVVSAEGVYTLVVTDLAGNTTTVHFVIDKTNPTVSGVIEGAYYNHDLAIDYSDINLSGALLNGVPYVSGTLITTEGNYTLVVTDLAGNTTTVHFVIDKTVPAVGGVANGTYHSGSVCVSFSDLYLAGALLNGVPFSSGTCVVAEGSYSLDVWDLAGNHTIITFVIDRTNPLVVGVCNGCYYSNPVTISFSDANLAGATIDGNPFVGGTIASEGVHTLVVTDLAGNTTTIVFVIDLTNPIVSGVCDGCYYNHSVTISFSDSNLAGATLNGGSFAGGVVSAEGAFVLVVSDLAGNTITIHFVIDFTAPVVIGVTDGAYYNHPVTISFLDSSLSGATLNGNSFAGGVVSLEGSYILIANDLAGNSITIHFVIDLTNPVVTGVTGGAYYNHPLTISFSDTNLAGATLNGNPFVGGVVSAAGNYSLIVTDLAGNSVTVNFVIDYIAPAIGGVLDSGYYNHAVTVTYSDAYPVSALLNGVAIPSATTVAVAGHYTLVVTDAAGNSTSVSFVIDYTAPVITLNGSNSLSVEVNNPYAEPGFTATDNEDGDITLLVIRTGTVNTSILGIYTLTYSVTDRAGNITTVARTVRVVDTTKPVVTVVGPSDITLMAGSQYTELGAVALDNYDGDISSKIVISGVVDWNTPGVYTIVYTVTDSSGNTGTTVRTIRVILESVASSSSRSLGSIGATAIGSSNDQSVKGTESGEIKSGTTDEKTNNENKSKEKTKLPLLALLALLLLIGAGLYLLYKQYPALFGRTTKEDKEEKEE